MSTDFFIISKNSEVVGRTRTDLLWQGDKISFASYSWIDQLVDFKYWKWNFNLLSD
jgi:hypothetical protein